MLTLIWYYTCFIYSPGHNSVDFTHYVIKGLCSLSLSIHQRVISLKTAEDLWCTLVNMHVLSKRGQTLQVNGGSRAVIGCFFLCRKM